VIVHGERHACRAANEETDVSQDDQELSAHEVLTTTRSVRKRLDLESTVDFALIREAVTVALQAPTGGNLQGWTWIAIEDSRMKFQIAEFYRSFYSTYREHTMVDEGEVSAGGARMLDSGDHLAANLHRVPWLVIPCIAGPMGRADTGMASFAQAMTWGSIYPAIWSFQLALRARGLVSCLTTNHLAFEREVSDLLGIPFETTNQAALIPVARSIGTTFRPAARNSIDDVLRREHWSGPVVSR
jgi:nitroreductase